MNYFTEMGWLSLGMITIETAFVYLMCHSAYRKVKQLGTIEY